MPAMKSRPMFLLYTTVPLTVSRASKAWPGMVSIVRSFMFTCLLFVDALQLRAQADAHGGDQQNV